MITFFKIIHYFKRRRVVVITAVKFHSTRPELRFCAGLNSANGMSEIHDGEDILKGTRLTVFPPSTIPQKQFIIIIIITNLNISKYLSHMRMIM